MWRVTAMSAGNNAQGVAYHAGRLGILAKSATLELVVEARDPQHAREIRERLAANGFRQA
ncbi:MAG TPA: hypothetical protein VK683_00270 [Rhizomicrobium sp.]|nr:hypothetical protein [Rhizomicrobium sp.]